MDATITRNAGNRVEWISEELRALPIGRTRMIAWEAVTRWAEDSFEIGTWGKKSTTFEETLGKLA